MRKRKTVKPNYDNIAALEANLDPDGDGLFDGPLAENIPPPEPPPPPPITVAEATVRLERAAKRKTANEMLGEQYGVPVGQHMTYAASAHSTNYVQIVRTQPLEIIRSPYQ